MDGIDYTWDAALATAMKIIGKKGEIPDKFNQESHRAGPQNARLVVLRAHRSRVASDYLSRGSLSRFVHRPHGNRPGQSHCALLFLDLVRFNDRQGIVLVSEMTPRLKQQAEWKNGPRSRQETFQGP
jgi:hypothetical protein